MSRATTSSYSRGLNTQKIEYGFRTRILKGNRFKLVSFLCERRCGEYSLPLQHLKRFSKIRGTQDDSSVTSSFDSEHDFVDDNADSHQLSSDIFGEEQSSSSTSGRRSVPAEIRCFDTARINVQSGKGGDGIVSFRREKYVPRGGPDGGNGGRGGHVWVVAEKSITSLNHFRKKSHFRANKGDNGLGSKKNGAAGKDMEVMVPLGTIINRVKVEHDLQDSMDVDASFQREDDLEDDLEDDHYALMEDRIELLQHGDRKLLVHGGRGGRGNASFRSSLNKTPRLAEKGEAGLEEWFELELKLIADVGFIGAPNAGKSTMLSCVSNAKPKIAPYPFTTLVPNLGVCNELPYRSIVFADVPGLLEGAHAGVGLGQEFLRHCERCKVLIQVIDGDSPDPLGDYHAIRLELKLFNEVLWEKPYVIAINKMDIPSVLDKYEEIKASLHEEGVPIFPISALARQGVTPIIHEVNSLLSKLESEEDFVNDVQYSGFSDSSSNHAKVEYKKLRKRANDASKLRDFSDFKLEFEGSTRTWIVSGRGLESFVQMTDWKYYQAWKRFQKIIKLSGLYKELKNKGVRDGDTVVIESYQFEWNSKIDKELSFHDWMQINGDQ